MPQAAKGAGAEPCADRELILLFLGRTARRALVSEQGWGGTLAPVAACAEAEPRSLWGRAPSREQLSASSGIWVSTHGHPATPSRCLGPARLNTDLLPVGPRQDPEGLSSWGFF